ncbi:MAG: DegT/DnrJ/EryC1/StrS family aminotransferase [Candidatus Omnitrophota bacterium]|nr:DegT/DnrJ/EryC1/StrS family aminotransferase [Candidatus Omnitrophota bacterium]
MNWKIPMFKIYWDDEDVRAVNKVVKSGMQWAEGLSIKEFENKISGYIGVKYCIVFNSGTSAMHALLLAYGIGKGDEVIVPSFTFISTANAVLFVGAKPVFADIEEETFGLDPEDVKKKITRKTKAIIPIHYGGCPCRIRELKKIAQEHNLILIEDAAESFGANIKGKKVGTFGDSAMISFCQNKIIATGEGGAIVTNSRQICEKLKLIRSHGRLETEDYFTTMKPLDYVSLGYNFRMPSVIAALGISQLEKVENIIEMRRKNSEYLNTSLSQETGRIMTPNPPDEYFHVYQLYTIKVNKKYRNKLMQHLASKGIMTKVYFQPAHLSYFYKNKLKYKCRLPVTEKVSKEVITLPMYPMLKSEEMDYMVKEIKKVLR